ncbi:baseplate J-like protein [Chitinophaga skermanii]|uniref:Baseplate J-like protein n=1 Tax=Chitinophaga skermanii TaxID=331697 RepID=A0A327QRJ1_9BACT|nr:baseplate J/gp47 family protein [Chitinophaga skermanii]RAJ06515.1 baseplate J-like protein [Chitinophaga skermanii]
MNEQDNISNNLVRDGVSQWQRTLASLSTKNVSIDERSTSDILAFLYRYAKYVLYYDDEHLKPSQKASEPLRAEGDWQDFFRLNPPFQYAAVHQFDAQALQQAYQATRAKVKHLTGEERFWALFNRVFDLALQLEYWRGQLDDNTALKDMLNAHISTDSSKALSRLIAMANTMDEKPVAIVKQMGMLAREVTWQLSFDKLIAKDAYYNKLSAFPRKQYTQMLQQFDELFLLFYKGIQQVQQFALTNFNDELLNKQDHQPHVALIYAFIRLLDQVKLRMNTLPTQHLDFFYREVLRLEKKPLQPDHAHIVAELAKQVPQYLLKKGTGFKAGKDLLGKDIKFESIEDVVFNKAKVTQLRTLFRDEKAIMYAAPQAASADGLGDGFRNPLFNSWPLLGAKKYINKNNPGGGFQHFPFATTGLMLSSPVLLLKEGERTITVELNLQPDGADKSLQGTNFIALLAKKFYRLTEPLLKALVKDGFTKATADVLKAEIAATPSKEIWLTEETGFTQFRNFNNIGSTDKEKLKKAAGTGLLDIACTTADGWLPIPASTITLGVNDVLTISFIIPVGAPAIAPAPKDVLLADYDVKDPILSIQFNHALHYQLKEDTTPWYDFLSKQQITNARINAVVTKVKNILISNDEGALDPKNKFLPFTGVPKKQSNFFIGSDEVFRKRLSKLSFSMEWEGLPSTFQNHYLLYKTPIYNDSFKVKMEQLKNGSWESIGTSVDLFEMLKDQYNNPTVLNTKRTIEITNPSTIPLLQEPVPVTGYNPNIPNGFIRWRLEQDFLHEEYPRVMAEQAIRIGNVKLSEVQIKANNTKTLAVTAFDTSNTAKSWMLSPPSGTTDAQVLAYLKSFTTDIKTKDEYTRNAAVDLNSYVNFTNVPIVMPNPPYTPTLKDFTLEYTAVAEINDIHIFHQFPYEAGNYANVLPGMQATLMPGFVQQGYLYVGLSDALAGSNITLLFQLAAFTADPDINRANVEWHYLSGNAWKELLPLTHVISDTTQGFLTPGIVTIAIPWDADQQHTILPSGLHWLRASVKDYATAVCEGISVTAQAAEVVFVDQQNDPNRVSPPVAANNIADLLIPDAAISKINQPYAGFDGVKPENDEEFKTRVSERLRHKGRAINVFDYERLVLDAFPGIFKAKCIPHTKMYTDAIGETVQLSSPGWVTLAVIPRIDDYPSDEKFTPKVGRVLLEKVAAFLAPRSSMFTNIQVINPVYQKINFKGQISWKKGKDKNFCMQQVQQEVTAFLSPWVTNGAQDIIFGGTLMKSSVLQFIEQRDYVDFVTDFTMHVYIDESTEGPAVMSVTADTPWSVLVVGEQIYETYVPSTVPVVPNVFTIK